MANFLDVARKYGVNHPLAKKFNSLPSSILSETPQPQIDRSINNYQTRIEATGNDVPQPKDNTNIFIKVLEWLDKPRNAVWNAAEDAIKGENDLWTGLKQGWTGEEKYTGADLMRDLDPNHEVADNNWTKVLGGFLTEVVADPLNLATFGAGSFAKGLATGGVKKLTQEGAEALAKGGMKSITKEGLESTARKGLEELGETITKESLDAAARKLAGSQLDNVVRKYGAKMGDAGAYKSIDEMLQMAHDTIKAGELANDARKAGKGMSILGKTLISDEAMQKAGAAVSHLVEKVPVLGDALTGTRRVMSTMFNSKYIKGLDNTMQTVVLRFRQGSKGLQNVADEALTQRFKSYTKALGSLGYDDATAVDRAIIDVLEGTANVDDIPENLRYIVGEMKDDFARWANDEHAAGVLNEFIESNYFPHVKNWGMNEQQLGRMTERLKFSNPSGRQREFGATLDAANHAMKYKTSSEEAQKSFADLVYAVAQEKKPKAIPSAQQIGDVIKKHNLDITKGLHAASEAPITLLDGVDDFFETSAVKAWIQRGLSHNKILADRDFFDNVVNGLGRRVTDINQMVNLREEGYDIVIPKSSIDAYKISKGESIKLGAAIKEAAGTLDLKDLDMATKAKNFSGVAGEVVDQLLKETNGVVDEEFKDSLRRIVEQMVKEVPTAQASRVQSAGEQILKQLITDTPEAFVRVNPDDLNTMKELGIFEAIFGRQVLNEAYAVKPGALNALQTAVRQQTNEGFKELARALDTVYRFWKPTVTGLNPAYHIRNFLGGMANGMLSIGIKMLDPSIQAHALRIANGSDSATVTIKGLKFTGQEIRDAMVQTGAQMGKQIDEFDTLNKQLAREYTGKVGGTAWEKTKNVATAPAHAGKVVGEKVEGQIRTVNFIGALQQGIEKGMTREQALEYAGELVKQFQFDYTELTEVEKWLRRIFPFYSWARKNIPLQLENFLNNPSVYTLPYKAHRNSEEAQGIDGSNMPEWLETQMPIAVGTSPDGTAQYLNPSMPMSDLGAFNDIGKYVTGMLSPMIKAPLEITQNRQMLTGAPIYKNDYEKSSKVLQHLVNQFGIARDLQQVGKEANNDAAVSSDLLEKQMLLRNYNPAAAEEDAKFDYNRQLSNFVQYLKDTGIPVPDMTDLKDPSTGIGVNVPRELEEIIARTGVIPPYLKNQREYGTGYTAAQLQQMMDSQGLADELTKNYETYLNRQRFANPGRGGL